jgi:hypothetical protein
VSQLRTRAGEQSGLLTPIAATESVSLCERMKSLRRFWNSERRFIVSPDCHKAPTAQAAPMLNSARRHFTSPRRGRWVEWSDSRRGSERLHFRTCRICRRCACDASQESVSPGSIDVTTADKSLVIDSVKRCRGRSGIIESGKLVWRDKEESMSRA